MNWYLIVLGVSVLIAVVAYAFATYKKEIEKLPEKWELLRNGICPNCGKLLTQLLPEPVCPDCGQLNPAYITPISHMAKGIWNCCSFCGGKLEKKTIKENASEYHSKAGPETFSVHSVDECPDCHGRGFQTFIGFEPAESNQAS